MRTGRVPLRQLCDDLHLGQIRSPCHALVKDSWHRRHRRSLATVGRGASSNASSISSGLGFCFATAPRPLVVRTIDPHRGTTLGQVGARLPRCATDGSRTRGPRTALSGTAGGRAPSMRPVLRPPPTRLRETGCPTGHAHSAPVAAWRVRAACAHGALPDAAHGRRPAAAHDAAPDRAVRDDRMRGIPPPHATRPHGGGRECADG